MSTVGDMEFELGRRYARSMAQDAAFVQWEVVVEAKAGGERKTIRAFGRDEASAKQAALEKMGDANAGKWRAVSATKTSGGAQDDEGAWKISYRYRGQLMDMTYKTEAQARREFDEAVAVPEITQVRLYRPNRTLDRKAKDEMAGAQDAASDVRIVYNRILDGWYVVRGSSDTPISGRFGSKEEAQAWLRDRQSNRDNLTRRDGAQDAFDGYVVSRIGEYKIIEGIGPNGGRWAASGRGETKIFSTRREAEEHAALSTDR